jgi:hypothetical protein
MFVGAWKHGDIRRENGVSRLAHEGYEQSSYPSCGSQIKAGYENRVSGLGYTPSYTPRLHETMGVEVVPCGLIAYR